MFRPETRQLRILLVLVTVGLLGLAVVGCLSADAPSTDPPAPVPAPDDPEPPAGPSAQPDVSAEGPSTSLPVYPGSTRRDVYDLDGGFTFVDIYVANAPLDDVITYFREQFAGWEDVGEAEGSYGDGDYTFERLGDIPEDNFILTLAIEDDNVTVIEFMASSSFFE